MKIQEKRLVLQMIEKDLLLPSSRHPALDFFQRIW